jgi:hypothetical protein
VIRWSPLRNKLRLVRGEGTSREGAGVDEGKSMSDEERVEQDNKRVEQDNNSRTIYQELCNSYRAIDDFRAKLLGFLPLATGTGIFLLLDNAKLLDDANFKGGPVLVAAGAFGFAVTLGLFFYELYGIKKCHALINAGRILEGTLRVDAQNGQFTERPREVAGLINEPFAAGVIYPAVLAAWTFLAVFFMPKKAPWWAPQDEDVVWWAIGVFIIGFTISLFFNLWLKLELEEKIKRKLKLAKNSSITMSLVRRWWSTEGREPPQRHHNH